MEIDVMGRKLQKKAGTISHVQYQTEVAKITKMTITIKSKANVNIDMYSIEELVLKKGSPHLKNLSDKVD